MSISDKQHLVRVIDEAVDRLVHALDQQTLALNGIGATLDDILDALPEKDDGHDFVKTTASPAECGCPVCVDVRARAAAAEATPCECGPSGCTLQEGR
jgi:hypothetical protein